MTLQPAMKLNCANSAVMFYALKLYLTRSSSATSFGESGSLEVSYTLGQLLSYARYVCPAGSHQPLYEFQWSLFIAAIETGDMIHREWLQVRITDRRFSEALQQISRLKSSESGVVCLETVRQVLRTSWERRWQCQYPKTMTESLVSMSLAISIW